MAVSSYSGVNVRHKRLAALPEWPYHDPPATPVARDRKKATSVVKAGLSTERCGTAITETGLNRDRYGAAIVKT